MVKEKFSNSDHHFQNKRAPRCFKVRKEEDEFITVKNLARKVSSHTKQDDMDISDMGTENLLMKKTPS